MRFVVIAVLLTGCAAVDLQATLEQRCAGYRQALANLEVLQAVKHSEARETRLELYRGLIAANCPES